MINYKTLLILFFLIPTFSYTQDTIYFNSAWKTCIKNEASFYRVITPFKKHYKFEDYYLSGKMQMEGFSITKDSLFKTGKFTYLNEDGTIDKITNFKNNVENGEYKLFYRGNIIKEIGTRKNGLRVGKNTQYFENGVIERISHLKSGKYNGKVIYFNEKGIMVSNGQNKDDVWFGKWEEYEDDGTFRTNLYYLDYFKIKESRITINTPNNIWTYFPRENNEHNYTYFCRNSYDRTKARTYLENPPEIYIVVPKESENSSLNNIKIENKDKYEYSLSILDSNIKISDIFLTKTNSKNDKQYSNIYIELLVQNKKIIIKIVVLSDKLNYYEPTIKEFISNISTY